MIIIKSNKYPTEQNGRADNCRVAAWKCDCLFYTLQLCCGIFQQQKKMYRVIIRNAARIMRITAIIITIIMITRSLHLLGSISVSPSLFLFVFTRRLQKIGFRFIRLLNGRLISGSSPVRNDYFVIFKWICM